MRVQMWIAGPPTFNSEAWYHGNDIVVNSEDETGLVESTWENGVDIFSSACDMTDRLDWSVAVAVKMDLYLQDSHTPTWGAKMTASRALADTKAAVMARFSNILSNPTAMGDVAADLISMKSELIKKIDNPRTVKGIQAQMAVIKAGLGLAPADTIVKSETWVVSVEAWERWVREILPMYLDHPHYVMSGMLIVDRG